jgi:putative membrane protein
MDFAQLAVIVPFALGCLMGIAAFSRVLGYLLARYEFAMLAGLTGLLVGSLWRIWPYQHTVVQIVREKPRVMEATPYLPNSLDPSVWLLMAVGLVAVLAIELVARKRRASVA